MGWLFFVGKVLFFFLLIFVVKFTSAFPQERKPPLSRPLPPGKGVEEREKRSLFTPTLTLPNREAGEKGVIKFPHYPIEPILEKKDSRKVVKGAVRKGETLIKVLLAKRVPNSLAHEIVDHLKPFFNFKKIKEGDRFRLIQNLQGDLVKFSLYRGDLDIYKIEVQGKKWNARKVKAPLKRRIEYLTGKVRSSIFEAVAEAGESEELALDFAHIFAWKVNFASRVKKGNAFKVIYEKFYKDNMVINNGKILAAEFKTGNKVLRALYFKDPDGKEDYFTPDGHSLKNPFLASPLKITKISSGFNHSRFHPILKKYKPHWGIDYPAPKGTPVSSVADGVVIFKGWDGGYGKKIGVKHSSGYISYYGHLSAFINGIKEGTRVKQKQVIGYVGSTGLSTGPHLHFGLWKNGHWLNPLKEIKPKIGRPIPKTYMPQFELLRNRLLKKLEAIPVG